MDALVFFGFCCLFLCSRYILLVVDTTAKCPFVHLNRFSHGWKGPAGDICGGMACP